MRQIDLSNATVEWLDAHVSKFPGMARHVPSDLDTARGLFLSESVGIPLTKATVPVDGGHIVMQTPITLDRNTLDLLNQTVILFRERTYEFISLSPVTEDKSARHAPYGAIEIHFAAA